MLTNRSAAHPLPLRTTRGVLGDVDTALSAISMDDKPPQTRSIAMGAFAMKNKKSRKIKTDQKDDFHLLKLSTGLGFCSKTGSDIFRITLIYGKEQEPRKKIVIVQKISPS